MIVDGRCSYCGQVPERKINRHKAVAVDEIGNIIVVQPVRMVETPYYECGCGYKYLPQEVELGT